MAGLGLFAAMLEKMTIIVEGMKQEIASHEEAITVLEAQIASRREAVAKDKRKLRDLEFTRESLQHLEDDTPIPLTVSSPNPITKEDIQKLLKDHQQDPWRQPQIIPSMPYYPSNPTWPDTILPYPNEPYITWTTTSTTPNFSKPTVTVSGYTREANHCAEGTPLDELF
jgi:hypothetical protein